MSKKKDIARLSLRRLKITAVALLVVFGPLLLVYSWLATRPTGYESLAEKMEEAEAAVQRRFEASVASVGRDELTTGPILAARAGSNELTSGPLPVGETRMEQVSLGEQLAANWTARRASRDFPVAWMNAMPSPYRRWYVWSGSVVGPIRFADEHPDRGLELNLGNRTEILSRIKESSEMWKGSLRTVTPGNSLTADERSKLAEGMNRAERLMLGKHPATEGMTADQSFRHWQSFEEPIWLGLLAMLRAEGLGDAAKAEALLRGHLAAIQELRLASYPYGGAYNGWGGMYFCAPIMWGARISEISDDALARADAQLAGFILTPEELEQFQVVYARRATETFANRVEADQVASGREVFNYFFDGRPERGWRRAMGPVLKNHLERLTVAWAGYDEAAWIAAETEHQRLLPWLNVKSPGALSHFYQGKRARILMLARGGFNDEIVEARLVLAAERYRRGHGEYPKSLEALSGDYPYVRELSTPELQCSIFRLEDIQIPVLPDMNKTGEDRYDRVRRAIEVFRSEIGRFPQSAEELRPYCRHQETFHLAAEIFVSYPSQPVFCFTRRESAGSPGAAGSLSVNALFPVNPQIPDWLRQAVSEKSSE